MSDFLNTFLAARFFKQDIVTVYVTSFSLGNVWVYFFREIPIGIRDIETDDGYFLDITKNAFPPDQYASQHLLTQEIINDALEEGVSPRPPVFVKHDDFPQLMLKIGFRAFERLIDKGLLAEI
jgi:hypothetical protein